MSIAEHTTRSTPAVYRPHGYIKNGLYYANSPLTRFGWWVTLPFKIILYLIGFLILNAVVAMIFFPAFVVLGIIEVFALIFLLVGGFHSKRGIYEGDCPHCERHIYLAESPTNCPICTRRVIVENSQIVAIP